MATQAEIEAAAKALCRLIHKDDDAYWRLIGGYNQYQYLKKAQAALEAAERVQQPAPLGVTVETLDSC